MMYVASYLSIVTIHRQLAAWFFVTIGSVIGIVQCSNYRTGIINQNAKSLSISVHHNTYGLNDF